MIAVLLFHLGFAPASGGFVGVDVFFVISGFLIGGIVVHEAEAGTLRLGDCFARRLRRILPVMLVSAKAIRPILAPDCGRTFPAVRSVR